MARRIEDSVATRTPGFTRGAVVTAALELIDQDGLPAVTMRALASRLGVRAQSLHPRVDGRKDLLDALADSIVNEIDDDPKIRNVFRDPWQRSLADTARAVRRYTRRHPNASVLLDTVLLMPTGRSRRFCRNAG